MQFIPGMLSSGAALVAALYWYRSSKVAYPPALSGLVVMDEVAHISTEPLVAAARENGRLNNVAARWVAIAAVLAAGSAILPSVAAALVRTCT